MKNKKSWKNYLEKNKTSPLLKTPEKDFHYCLVSDDPTICIPDTGVQFLGYLNTFGQVFEPLPESQTTVSGI